MPLYFDTLKFAERLKAAGEQNSIAHAEALKEALEQNIFSKGETEKMFAEALQRFDKRTDEIASQMTIQRIELVKEMAIQRAELITEIHKTAWVTISVISGLFAVIASLGAALHFLH
jgi:predicted transcriptional regulator